MKPIALPASLLLFALPALASGSALPAEALSTWNSMAQVHTLEATYRQVRTSRLLARPLVSTGTLRFERPDRLAWITASPARSTLVMNGPRVGMAWPDLGISEEIVLSDNPEVAQMVQGMMVWMNADLGAVEKDYTVTWTSGPPARAVLVPRSATVAAMFARIELTLEGAPPTVRTITLVEPDQDRVEITLSDIQADKVLSTDAFALPVPSAGH